MPAGRLQLHDRPGVEPGRSCMENVAPAGGTLPAPCCTCVHFGLKRRAYSEIFPSRTRSNSSQISLLGLAVSSDTTTMATHATRNAGSSS